MKTAPFLLLSLCLHAAALTYPILFSGPAGERVVPIEVLSLQEGSGNELAGKDKVRREEGRAAAWKRRANVNSKIEQPNREAEKATVLENEVSISINSPTVSDDFPAASAGTVGISSFPVGAEGTGGGESGGWGNSNIGAGAGFGGGSSGDGSGFAQVSYAYSPKPRYPDRARTKGWEGTVLLRILVDEDGRAKLIQINRTSGFEALDDAALETVRHWRFYPAHYGERRIESWVKIPIIFRLADLRD